AVLTRCVESSASLLFFLFGHAISVIGPLSLHDALPISAGLVLSGGALVLLFLMPVAGVLVGKFQARYIIGFGWLVLSLGMYYSTQHLDLDISFWTASFLRVVQVFGLAFLFVPINIVSYVGMPAD